MRIKHCSIWYNNWILLQFGAYFLTKSTPDWRRPSRWISNHMTIMDSTYDNDHNLDIPLVKSAMEQNDGYSHSNKNSTSSSKLSVLLNENVSIFQSQAKLHIQRQSNRLRRITNNISSMHFNNCNTERHYFSLCILKKVLFSPNFFRIKNNRLLINIMQRTVK